MHPYYVYLQSSELAGTDAADTVYVPNVSGHKLRVEACYIVPNAAVAADATNYITITLRNGVGGATIASHSTASTGGSAMSAGVPIALSVSGGTAGEVPDGGVIEVAATKAGVGPTYAFLVALRCSAVRE